MKMPRGVDSFASSQCTFLSIHSRIDKKVSESFERINANQAMPTIAM